MKTTIYELLGMVKDKPNRSIYVKYFDRVNKKEDVMWACKENIIYKLERLVIELNDEIEIIEDTPKEESKIPEKLTWNKKSQHNIVTDNTIKTLEQLLSRSEQLKKSINEIIDYLESKEK